MKMKKVILIILSLILLLLPTITAVILEMMPEGVIQAPITVSGTFWDENGAKYDFDKNNHPELAVFFNTLSSNSSQSNITASEIDGCKQYYADVTQRGSTKQFILYLSLTDNCYYSDHKGDMWKIDEEHASSLLATKYVIALYEDLHTPYLITFSNDTVVPSFSDFKYTTKNGSTVEGSNSSVTSREVTYYSSNTTDITFSINPYICTVKAYVNENLVYDGALSSLGEAGISTTDTVRYEIEATWQKSSENNCFGSAKYSFLIKYSPIPSFSVDRTSINAGDFVVVKASNIIDVNKIVCTFDGGLETTPVFFRNYNYYYALVPIGVDVKTGKYSLTLSYGETNYSVSLDVTERKRTESTNVYNVKAPLTEQALSDMKDLISVIGLNCTDKKFENRKFINYELSYINSFKLLLGFGRIRPTSEGLPFDMIGIEFSAEEGVEIPVINGGIVCASGEDTVLGKYIVVDHGYGLKSWYCNISEACFEVGDEVSKSDIIAKTGSSAFYGKSGFYLITTILDRPVCPYAIYENDFYLPR